MKNQKEAIFQLVKVKLGKRYDPDADAATIISMDERKEVAESLFRLFKDKTLKRTVSDTDWSLEQYCWNMVQHWIRRDKRLNGGKKYLVTKKNKNLVLTNEIFETISLPRLLQDSQLNALLALFKTLKTKNDEQEVKEYIICRILELDHSRKKTA